MRTIERTPHEAMLQTKLSERELELNRTKELLASTEAQVAGLIRDRDEWQAKYQATATERDAAQRLADERATKLKLAEAESIRQRDALNRESNSVYQALRGEINEMHTQLEAVRKRLDGVEAMAALR